MFAEHFGKAGRIARALGMTLLLTAGALAFLPASLSAEPLNLRYSVDVAGMKAFKVRYQGNLKPGSYEAGASVKPAGLASLFISRRMNMQVRGRLGSPQARPVTFSMTTGKKKKQKHATISWSGGKVASWKRNPPRSAERAGAIRRAIAARPVLDPLSMLIEEGLKGPEKFCTGTRRIFDGHTVYDLRFTRLGRKQDGTFGIPLYRCRMTYVPVAGMSEKKRRKALKSPPVFEVAFAPVLDRDVGTILVPVSARGRLKGKPFHARLAAATIGGRPLKERVVRGR
jgi:hypothetical protein